MLVKIFGGIDIFIGVILIFGIGLDIPSQILFFLGFVLLAKSSLGLWKDVGSWIDVAVGLIFMLMILVSIPKFIGIILGIIMVQKGAVSFL